MNDAEFMRIAIEESKKGDWPYGAVIVKDGAIVVKGFNTATRDRDTTAHAEVNMIRAALLTIPDLSLKGYTLYTSSELARCAPALQSGQAFLESFSAPRFNN
jgi:tRNA(adenine34) deaminase